MSSKIIYFLFAAAILNGATDGHAATRPAQAESSTQASFAAETAEQPMELRGSIKAALLPPLPSTAELRLKH